ASEYNVAAPSHQNGSWSLQSSPPSAYLHASRTTFEPSITASRWPARAHSVRGRCRPASENASATDTPARIWNPTVDQPRGSNRLERRKPSSGTLARPTAWLDIINA